MANVFTKQTDVVNKPRRNVFDLSHANNLTLKFGALTPCFCEEVIPGDSFQIETRMALKLMPMVFPVQTDMRAYVHFFYVRNRNLWKDWQDFIGLLPAGYTESQMQKYQLPYINFDKNDGIGVPRTGSLSDYLGLPTTLVGRYASEEELTYEMNFSYFIFQNEQNHYYLQMPQSKISNIDFYRLVKKEKGGGSVGQLIGDPVDFYVDPKLFTDFNLVPTTNYEKLHNTHILWTVSNPISPGTLNLVTTIVNGVECVTLKFFTFTKANASTASNYLFLGVDENNNICWSTPIQDFASNAAPTELSFTLNNSLWLQTRRIVILTDSYEYSSSAAAVAFTYQADGGIKFDTSYNAWINVVQSDLSGTEFTRDVDADTHPYYCSDNADGVKISALPFRAYESVYNAFYRDPRNNPLILNGTPEYNKWCPSTNGGVDNTNYQLHYRNWEADFLTTALPSPQQGEAPLVGITNSGKLAFVDETGTTYRADLEFTEDNSGIKGINVQASNEPVGSVTRIVDFATSGISIADLRGVNALQRWLEINARRGYRYKDQIKSHFDVDIRFDELDMPEFLGGCSADIYVNQISQTVNQSDSGTWQDTLGAYAGQGFTRMENSRPIRHYFDEHGYIIGIISVVPIPCYSQLLPKHFIKRNPLDFYFPEFSKLGMQPITYSEVCPVQTFVAEGNTALQDTFGYQRAWYEYLARVDEVHGSFRLTMRNFLINRIFNKRPELGEEFLTVSPEQINQVFSVTEDSDKIFGQLYFKVTAKRPIPEYGIPALE